MRMSGRIRHVIGIALMYHMSHQRVANIVQRDNTAPDTTYAWFQELLNYQHCIKPGVNQVIDYCLNNQPTSARYPLNDENYYFEYPQYFLLV